MAINFVQGQVAVGDPSPIGPTATSNVKDVRVKVIKLTSANFTTTGVNTKVAVFPADATILDVHFYTKTALSGGGVTAPLLSLGTTSAGTDFANAFALTNTTGTLSEVSPITGLIQNYGVPQGPDIQFWARGTCSTGNPTAGEIYLIVKYVR